MFEYLARDRRLLRRGTRAFAREVVLGDARIFVDHGFQWDGANNVWLTRARASYVVQAGPILDLRPRGLFSRMIGFHSGVPSGDACFDDFFAVRTTAPADAWAALTTRVRSLLADSFDDARLISDGSMVTLWREGDFGREVDADAAIEIVNEVVHYRAGALAALRRLPGAVAIAATGAWDDRSAPAVELATPLPVRVGPVAHRGRPVLTASAPCGRATSPFKVSFEGTLQLVADSDRFPDRLIDAALEVGASTFACDGARVLVRWPDLDAERGEILGAAQLVGAIASGQVAGLYR